MFRIKICGITSTEDAQTALVAGADAIGFNFYESSRRYIEPERAQEIASALGSSMTAVGLFVNSSVKRINFICGKVGIETVQLHGDEPPEFLGELGHGLSIVRARRVSVNALAQVEQDLQACSRLSGFAPDAVLLDAESSGQYGGTGKSLPWDELVDWNLRFGVTPLILAGGLTPENVAEAIRIVRPHGVDVASGVESSPGVKDTSKVRFFLEQAQEAFTEISS